MVSSTGGAPHPVVIGRYQVYGPLGVGGMGTVSLGRIVAGSEAGRTVAIKQLHPHLAADPTVVAGLINEAKLAAEIRHPNVVSMLDVVSEAGEVLLVMEYVHGASLARLAPRAGAPAPLDPRVATAVVEGALRGLHAAHEARDDSGKPLEIVHRDVSPQNVLVGVDGVTRILDFGVAKATARSQDTRGELIGKLAYTAPERLRRRPATRASDVYGASVILWELLSGRPLFHAEDEAAMIEEILVGLVDPPSALVRGVSPELSEIVLRGLHPDPQRRFSTARDMALALERCVPPAPPEELGAWVQETVGEELDQRGSMTVTAPPQRVRAEPAPQAAMLGLALASVTAAALLVTATVLRPRPPPPLETGGAETPPEPQVAAPLASAEPSVDVPPEERTSAGVPPVRQPRARAPARPAALASARPPKSAAPASPPSAQNCTSVDGEGLVHYDYECLKRHAN